MGKSERRMPRKGELLNGESGGGKARVISGVSAMHGTYRDFLAELAIEMQGAISELSWGINNRISKEAFEYDHKVIMGAWAGLRHFIYSDAHFMKELNEMEKGVLKKADEVLFYGETEYLTPEASRAARQIMRGINSLKEKLKEAQQKQDDKKIKFYEELLRKKEKMLNSIIHSSGKIESSCLAPNHLIILADIMLKFLKEKGLINPFQMTKTIVEE